MSAPLADHRARIARAGAGVAAIGWIAYQIGRMLRLERAMTGGEISLPLDDGFIYLQYARAMAEGHPFVYTPGNAPTTGATSLLFPLLLLPPHLLRLGPEAAIAWTLALGAVAFAVSAFLMARLARMLGGPVAMILAPILLLGSPYLLWGYMSGMEIGVYAAALLATVTAYLRERGAARFPTFRWWVFALAAARPEGAALAGLLAIAATLDRRRAARRPGGPPLVSPALLLPFAAAALPFLVNLILTGTPETTGATAKSILSEPHPELRARMIRDSPLVWQSIGTVYLAMFQSEGPNPLPQFVAVNAAGLGLLVLLMFAPRHRPWMDGRVLLALLPAGVVVSSLPVVWEVHLFRYLQGFFPLVLVAFAAGWGRLAWLARERLPRALGAPLAALALALPATSWISGFAREYDKILTFYAHNCENILHQQVAVGRWIDANLPRDAIIALNDAGALAYYGKRRTVDLIGLTTEGLARAKRDGDGPLFEALRRLPEERRPTYFAIYPGWFPSLSTSGLLGPEAYRAHLAFNTICGGTDKIVYPAVWTDTAPTDLPSAGVGDLEGRKLVDTLDHGWLEDEERHRWASFGWVDRGGPGRPDVGWGRTKRDVVRRYVYEDRPTRPVTDAGRVIRGGERFRARLAPGRDALLVMRTDAWFPSRLRVSVDGMRVGTWRIDRAESVWIEPRFVIPGDRIRSSPATIEIGREDPRARGDYAPFHYWFYQ